MFPCAPILNQAAQKGLAFFYTALDPSLIPDKAGIDALVGLDDIIMVGYPNGLWDSVNNLPILRAGTTATHPKYGYEGKAYFLIDCACFPGSSGSPVFIYNPSGWGDRLGNVHVGQGRLLFLAVLCAGPQHIVEGSVGIVEVPELVSVRFGSLCDQAVSGQGRTLLESEQGTRETVFLADLANAADFEGSN